MSLAVRRRPASRQVALDRSLEALPLFRLSDSADDTSIAFELEDGGLRADATTAPHTRMGIGTLALR